MIGLADIIDAAAAHAAGTGWFDAVPRHEPKNAPGKGLSAVIFMKRVRPVAAHSGLAATSALVELNIRLGISMTREPQDDIDIDLAAALDDLMGAYHANFTLGGLVSHVDLLNRFGTPMSADWGYLNQDSLVLRVVMITLPLVVNDAWEQAP